MMPSLRRRLSVSSMCFRFCINYHELNKVTKDSYPMSDANKGLNGLGGSKFRSKFDAASGYWQLPMEPGASEMAAFVAKSGLSGPTGHLFF